MGSSPLFTMHPYQMSYFNPLAGDPATVHTRYETDYWVSSYKEGAEWINERQRDIQRQLEVLVAANSLSSLCAVRYLDKKIKPDTIFGRVDSRLLPEPFDYYLSTTRYGLHKNFPEAEIVHEISRNGILLSVIKGHSRVGNKTK
jgi:hypothetical protein